MKGEDGRERGRRHGLQFNHFSEAACDIAQSCKKTSMHLGTSSHVYTQLIMIVRPTKIVG